MKTRKPAYLALYETLRDEILSGVRPFGSRLPSRDRLACICIGMQMTEEDTQYLMRLCGHAPLYARDRRDAVILHGLLHHSSLYEINNALIDHQMDPLL